MIKALSTEQPSTALQEILNSNSNWFRGECNIANLNADLETEAKSLLEEVKATLNAECPYKVLAEILYMLQAHFVTKTISEAQARNLAKDYARLLSGYSEKEWRAAYDNILLNRDDKYFPTIKEMKQYLQAERGKLKYLMLKLTTIIKKVEDDS